MLDLRVYRTAFLPALIAVFVAAFSLADRPTPATSPLSADAFDGARAFGTGATPPPDSLLGMARAFPDRRAGMVRSDDGDERPVEVRGLRIDPAKRTVTRDGEPITTTYVEFEILLALASAPGRVFTRDMLLARVWGDSAYRDPRTIDVHIRHLREKLEADPKEPEYLFTVRGVGYRFRDEEA